MKEKVVGILGGMGPEATVDLMSSIIKATHAEHEEDHLRIIVDNNPKMPSRQDAIIHGTESPVPAMVETAKNLQNAGADFVIIGANTAHYFYDEVSAQVDIPFLHIIDETIKEIQNVLPNVKKVGVLATNAAVQAHLYDKSCDKFGVEIIPASDTMQNQIHDAIFDFKYNSLSPKNIQWATEVAEYLIKEGAEALIMGCTEIPLILREVAFGVPVVDPNEIIAKVAVAYAKNQYEL